MTVLLAGTRGDAIRARVSGVDVEHLAIAGTVRGVVPLAAAARCGPGTGSLIFAPSPRTLRFQAPGSSSPGLPVAIAADGSYLLEDLDTSKWLRVEVVSAWLPASPAQANVFLADRLNEVGPSDVAASEAAAGGVDLFTLTLANVSPDQVRNVRAWLDPRTSGLAISTDGATWKVPTSETDPRVLSWASIAFASSVTLYVRRTIVAGSAPAASILNLLQLAWDGL